MTLSCRGSEARDFALRCVRVSPFFADMLREVGKDHDALISLAIVMPQIGHTTPGKTLPK